MNSIFKYIFFTGILILLQLAILNNIYISFGITIFLYPLIILILPYNIKDWVLLLIGFFIGIIIDFSFNTGGIHAFSTVFISFIRVKTIKSDNTNLNETSYRPGIQDMGFLSFLKYLSIFIPIHNILIYFLEAFHFNNFFYTLWIALINSVISIIACYVIEILIKKEK